MPPVHGMGRGGWWCYTLVVNGGHSHHGTVHSSTRLHSAYEQVHSGPLGGAPRRPWGMENPQGYNWCWFGTTMQCLLVASGGHGAHHPQCLDDGGIWGTLWQDVLANVGRGAYNPQAFAERLAEEGGMCVAVCRCSGHCKCKAPTPKFQSKQQSEMPERWKYMVAKLTGAGVVDLTCYISYEQLWQRCRKCNVKFLREGGGDKHDSTGTACEETGATCARTCEGGNEGSNCWLGQ